VPERLEVRISDALVATLDFVEPQRYELRYDSDWLTGDDAFPISLSIPLQSTPITGDALSAFLDNLLPDNAGVRERWALDAGLAAAEPFQLLKAYGSDTAGALQFLDPDAGAPSRGGRVPVTEEEIGDRIRAIREDDTAWHGADGEMGSFSLGGAQGKFSLGRAVDGWYEAAVRWARLP
jgi:serine/threonine-protein kinase HipA